MSDRPTQKGYMLSRQIALFDQPDCVGFGDAAFSVRVIHRDLANEIIRDNHYSGKVYSASRIHLGVVAGDVLKGVLQFGAAMNPQSMDGVVAGTRFDEYLELNRMWLCDSLPRNSESQALSYSIKFIRREFQKIKWIQSFADERCACFGVVYQACSFDYLGEHVSTFWELDGVFYHNSIMTKITAPSPAGRMLQANRERAVPHELRQFRYIKFLRPRFRKGLRFRILPYPKF